MYEQKFATHLHTMKNRKKIGQILYIKQIMHDVSLTRFLPGLHYISAYMCVK